MVNAATANCPPGRRLRLRVDPERRTGVAGRVDRSAGDVGAEVVGSAAGGGGRRRVRAVTVRLRLADVGPALEVTLGAAALDVHRAVGLHRCGRAGEVNLAGPR